MKQASCIADACFLYFIVGAKVVLLRKKEAFMEIGCITKEVRFGKERLAEADFFLMLFSA